MLQATARRIVGLLLLLLTLVCAPLVGGAIVYADPIVPPCNPASPTLPCPCDPADPSVPPCPEPVDISGILTFPDGRTGIAGATITITRPNGTVARTLTTGADGSYATTFPRPTTSFVVTPSKRGYIFVPASLTVSAGGGDASFTGWRRLTPADFNGDGRTDASVFRPSDRTWYVQRPDGSFYGSQFGADGDVKTPGDYNGDGRADFAVFRPSDHTWYVQRPDGSFYGSQFGQSGDIPVAADYDGDGRTDLAVYRPSDRTWYVQRPDGSFYGVQFGAERRHPRARRLRRRWPG